MKRRHSGSTVRSLLELNNDCLLEISKYLGLYDIINLAKTCHRLKSLADSIMFKKYSELTIDRAMLMKGQDFMDVLSYIGSHVQSLNCKLDGVYTKCFWSAIHDECKYLKKIFIGQWNEKSLSNFSNFNCFQNVEVLILEECNFIANSNFLASFRNLNTLISYNSANACDVKALFKNNNNLISFSYLSYDEDWKIDMRCFDMVPKLETLGIDLPNLSEYKTLVDFNNLKKLDLFCYDKNINDLLIQLAAKGILEELEVKCVSLDKRCFEILKTFTKLQLLVINNDGSSNDDFQIRPSFHLPPNLKHFTLAGIVISFETLISAIKQLKNIENIDLWRCDFVREDLSKFEDLNYLRQRVLKVIDHHYQRKVLSIILPLDICRDKDKSQDLSEYMCENGKPPTFVPHKPVTGVIGASFSVVSIMVANILRLFKIPQISYASTSTELSDKSRFEYFSRVVPPDNFQAQAMVEILKTLGWRYVSTVAVEGDYGEKGIASFISIAHDLGICVAVSEKVSRHSKPNDFDRIIERLSQKPQARAVVMFVDEDNTRKLLLASIRANKTGHFYWVGSDSWGAKVHPVRDHEYAAVNAITVLPHRTSLVGFDEYYARLKPTLDRKHCTEFGINIPYGESNKFRLNCRNIWFNEYWSQHHRCSLNRNDENACTGNETMGPYEQEGLVPFVGFESWVYAARFKTQNFNFTAKKQQPQLGNVFWKMGIDAVFAMAHALDELYKDVCGGIPYNDCAEMNSASIGPRLLKYILKVSFVGRQGSLIHFNKDGDAYGSYNIYQYQQNDNKYDYVPIGTWKEGLNLNVAALKWQDGIIPQSICSGPCPIGHVKNHQDQCCWSCLRCREDSYVDNDTCITCPPGWAPNEKKSDCDKLTPQVIDWKSPWALVPLIFAAIGIGCTVFTVCVFIKFNKTPVIMASGRELCYVLLLGILSSYGMTFLILSEPTVKRCATVRVGLGLCLSLCYSAIFIKTNRISRIFNRGVKTVHRPIYTSPISQVAICLGIALLNVAGTIVWLIYEEPDVWEVYPSPLTAVLSCKVSEISLVLSLMFNMLLILLCTLYAFKTRKIPENYNEAKYIAFTMYSTCIVWLAFLPIYFSTKNDYRIQMSCLCTCLMISASVPLGCLFVPKVYLVLFQPYKNVRQTNGKKMGGDQKAKYSMQHSVTKVQDQSTTTVSRTSPHFDQQTNDEIDVYVLDPSLELKNLQ